LEKMQVYGSHPSLAPPVNPSGHSMKTRFDATAEQMPREHRGMRLRARFASADLSSLPPG
jgi:hypothetical protein